MSVEALPDGTLVITGDSIQQARRIALAGMLSLELKGMRRSHPPSAYAIIKQEFGLTGSRQKVFDAFCRRFDIQLKMREVKERA